MASELNSFVKEALEKGVARPQVAEALGKAGWGDDEIRSALGSYAEFDFPLPVPKRRPYLSAREAFIYLLLFLTLYIGSYSLGALLFNYVNKWLPLYEWNVGGAGSRVDSLLADLPRAHNLSDARDQAQSSASIRRSGSADLRDAFHRRGSHNRRPHRALNGFCRAI
jgi:hypothetical protein